MRLFAVLVCLGAAAALAGGAAASRARVACGSFRPAVATLQDRPALRSGHRTTVAALAARRPARPGVARSQAERFVYAVRARLVKGRTDATGEDRVVLADPATGATLTAIFPPDACHARAKPAQAGLMEAALESFNEACAPLEYLPWTTLTGEAELTGVLFYGPDGRPQLEPILRFRLVEGGC